MENVLAELNTKLTDSEKKKKKQVCHYPKGWLVIVGQCEFIDL